MDAIPADGTVAVIAAVPIADAAEQPNAVCAVSVKRAIHQGEILFFRSAPFLIKYSKGDCKKAGDALHLPLFGADDGNRTRVFSLGS